MHDSHSWQRSYHSPSGRGCFELLLELLLALPASLKICISLELGLVPLAPPQLLNVVI